MQFNEPNYPFEIKGADDNEDPDLTVDVTLSKFIDTSLLDLTVEKDHVLLSFKGKHVFQVVLPEEIIVDKSEALRSQSTGHLVIRMPKVNHIASAKLAGSLAKKSNDNHSNNNNNNNNNNNSKFEIQTVKNVIRTATFEDNPEVPPLE